MSFAKSEKTCLRRLAKMFETGSTVTSVQALFDGLDIDNGEKHAVCESLKQRGVIKPTYQMGQRLPYQIEVLAGVVAEHDRIVNDNKFERLKSGLLASWWFGIPTFVFVVVAAIIALVIAALGFCNFKPDG